MKLFPYKGLAFRILSSFVLIIVIVFTAQTAVYISRAQRRLHAELVNKGRLLIELLAYNSRVAVFTENKERLQDEAAGVEADRDIVLVEFYDGSLRPLHVSNATSRHPLPSDLAAGAAGMKPGETGMREEADSVEFMKPVVLQVNQNEASMYFGEATADQAARIIGYTRIVMTKRSLGGQMKSMLLTNAITGLIFVAMTIAVVFLWVKRIARPIESLTLRVHALGKGGEIDHVPVETEDEIGGLAGAFNTMLDERAAARESYNKIIMDIHDGIGGITTNISMLSEIALRAADPADVRKAVSTISDLSREGMIEIRSLMYSLDNKDLTWQTLGAELRIHGSKTLEPHGISFEMSSGVEENSPEPGTLLCLHLFRIYRETLVNIIKHAGAGKVRVELRVSRERLVLTVRDDGRGFDEASLAETTGRGIANMKARAAEIGGTVAVSTDRGARVTVEIPLVK